MIRSRTLKLRRGFTLLELMLAILLGAIIVFSTVGIFALLEKANRHQEARLERTQELAVARGTINNALSSLVMAPVQPGPQDAVTKEIEDYVRQAMIEEKEGSYTADTDVTDSRFLLQPDITMIGPDGLPTQLLRVTVRSAPIVGGLTEVGVVDGTYLSEAEIKSLLDRGQRVSGYGEGVLGPAATGMYAGGMYGNANGMTGGMSGSRSAAEVDTRSPKEKRAAKKAAKEADAAALGLGTGDAAAGGAAGVGGAPGVPGAPQVLPVAATTEAPRAPGFRGVFELRPDSETALLANKGVDPTEPETWSLWWREIPPDVDPATSTPAVDGDDDADAELLALERQSRSEGREIRLISGLTWAEWRVSQENQMVRKANAKTYEKLPAYVEFSFKTIDGRDEHWMFDVAWTSGQEPGTIVQNYADPLLGGGGIDVASIINDAINRAKAQEGKGGGDGETPTTIATGPNGSGKPGTNGQNGTTGNGTQVATGNGNGQNGNGTNNWNGTEQYKNPGLPEDLWQRILQMERQRNPGNSKAR